MHILVIDNPLSQEAAVIRFLEEEGFDTENVFEIKTAIAQLQTEYFDLVILKDCADMLEAVKKIRKISEIPMIALTETVDTKQRMALYKYGVDDYVSLHVDLTALRFRVSALLRRNPKHVNIDRSKHILKVGGLTLNNKTYEVEQEGKTIKLTPVQFRLLWIMASHQDEVLSKRFLYQTLFNRQYTRYDKGVDIHISRVRKKLGMTGRLSTIHGQGYCFS